VWQKTFFSTWGQRASICAGSQNKGALLVIIIIIVMLNLNLNFIQGDSGSPLMTTHLGLAFGHGILSSHMDDKRRQLKPGMGI
jgi:hypothetical protein